MPLAGSAEVWDLPTGQTLTQMVEVGEGVMIVERLWGLPRSQGCKQAIGGLCIGVEPAPLTKTV